MFAEKNGSNYTNRLNAIAGSFSLSDTVVVAAIAYL